MRTRFSDVSRIKRAVLADVEDGALGDLRHWFSRRYKMHAGVPWGDRTVGGLLEEAFRELAQELVELRDRWDPTEPDAPEVSARISEIEDVFREKKPLVYSEGMTGDPWIDEMLQGGEVPEGAEGEDEDWEDYSYKG